METLNVALKNCHGIRELDATFDFERGNAVAVYAPNGTMKTSLARTFKDLAEGQESADHMFPARETQRSLTDELGGDIEPADVVVVLSYDEELGPSESISTLLVNPEGWTSSVVSLYRRKGVLPAADGRDGQRDWWWEETVEIWEAEHALWWCRPCSHAFVTKVGLKEHRTRVHG